MRHRAEGIETILRQRLCTAVVLACGLCGGAQADEKDAPGPSLIDFASRFSLALDGGGLAWEGEPDEETDHEPQCFEKPWHFEFGFKSSHTKLAETKRLLDRRLDLPLRAMDVFGVFHSPDTPLDRKSNFQLTTLYLGVGRQESDWLIWTWTFGGGMGRDHTHQRFLRHNVETDFKYAYVYTGLTIEVYPWRVPLQGDYPDWSERLAASRPFVTTGLETGYVSAEGRGHYSVAPFRLYEDDKKIRDWITSYNLGLGWAFPLSRHWSLNLSGDYRFHFYRPDEYNSWTLTTALRYNF